uniref:Uncharacterized protein n=1 Tax=Anopheles minimus TaxID=112268 RepID=A0A182WHW8_9DIPT
MFKLLCLFAVVVVVAAMPRAPQWPAPGPAPMGRIVKREPRIEKREAIVPAEPMEAMDAVEGQDDMDKAETFGFGYHKVIHVYPSYYNDYYPGYYGYGYPGYYQKYYHAPVSVCCRSGCSSDASCTPMASSNGKNREA